jgi:predicted RNase H-like HicB family nuclease
MNRDISIGVLLTKYRFSVVIEKDSDGYFAFCPELQGCYTQGDTYEEVLKNIEDAIHHHIEDRMENGEEIPKIEMVSMYENIS